MRLGDPLNCKLDELQSLDCMTSQTNDKLDAILESGENGVENTSKGELQILDKHSFGNKLSVAKIQSLVSMASLRRGGLGGTRDCPPFVEFDMSIGGFAYLFFPSVFPCTNSSQSTTSIIHSNTEKGFPPVNGLSFSAWLCIERCNLSEDNDPIISLLSLFATYKLPNRKRHSFTCMEIFLCPKDKTLVVSTQQHKFRSRLGSQGEENSFVRKRERNKDAVYECPVLFDEGRWHHIAVVLQKIVLRGCMASLYLDGTLVKSQKVCFVLFTTTTVTNASNVVLLLLSKFMMESGKILTLSYHPTLLCIKIEFSFFNASYFICMHVFTYVFMCCMREISLEENNFCVC